MIFLEIVVNNKKENILFSRIEVDGTVTFDKNSTPTNTEITQKLSAVLEVDKNLIVVKKINTAFGKASADFIAYQYLSQEELLKQEPRVLKQREGAKKEAEEAKKAEAEKPVEEKPKE